MTSPTPEQVLRLNILQLANTHNESLEISVKRAAAYWQFVVGVEKTPEAQDAEAVVEPAAKRKKKKEVVEAISDEHGAAVPVVEPGSAEALEQFVKEESKSKEAAPAIGYKEVQMAVLDLVRNKAGGKALVVGILDQFGVATALDLKPEQYAEALELFKAAYNG